MDKPASQANHNRWMLAALMVGVFLSPLNVNFTSVSLPTMREYFVINVEAVTWVGTAYFIPAVVFMPLQAYLGQRWGLRRMYTSGLLLLSLGAFASALAPTFGWLLASRVLQGIGWSALYPLALILIRVHYPLNRQGTITGIYESAVGVATIIGPIVGGALVDFWGWPSVYIVVGLVASSGAWLSISSIPSQSISTKLPAFDWWGALSLTLAVLLLLIGVTRRLPVVLLVGVLLFAGWSWLAQRTKAPFVDPRILGNSRFLSAATAAMIRMIVGIAVLTSLPLFLEDVQKYSASQVGFILPIYSLFLFLGSQPGGRWSDRAGARRPSVVGFALMTLGVAILIFISVNITLFFIALALAIRGLGAGISQAPFAQAATNVVEPTQRAAAAGLYGMVRYGGLALGSALVGILLETRFEHYGSDGTGASAIPAFQELFAVLTLFGLVGLLLSWYMGKARPSELDASLPA